VARIAPHYLDCVVAIGFHDEDPEIHWAASGFFYGHFERQINEEESYYRVFLVSNRHVFTGRQIAKIRFNPTGQEPAAEYDIELTTPSGKPGWYTHKDPEVDIAAIQINAQALRDAGIELSMILSNHHTANLSKCREMGVSEGDGVFVLGFPMGIVGEQRNYVIIRHGAIARIRDLLAGIGKEFLLDTLIFPGNSGGPVIIEPSSGSIQGTKPIKASYVIGIVKSYVPYQDVALSVQTNRPRIIFEENSGLASAHPIDHVEEMIAELAAKKEVREEQPPEVVSS
jgi:S1-C subfamily serine protease